MPAHAQHADDGADPGAVRCAERCELTTRGHRVAGHTLGLRGELFLVGAGGLARALFELHQTAHEAVMTMLPGAWTEGLPLRSAVLPYAAAAGTALELPAQIRATPRLHVAGGDVLQHRVEMLGRHLRP